MKLLKTHILPYLTQSFTVVILLIFLGGLWLRVYHWEYYPFGFDQVQIVRNAQEIIDGDLVKLIGPRTGPADMFTGPLVYYWMALWQLFVPVPEVVVFFSVSIYVVTFLVIAPLAWEAVGGRKASIILALWAFSPMILPIDRLPWNPNLTMLAASLSFFPLIALETKPKKWRFIIALFFGAFLGYQAHFSGLFLPPLIIISLCVLRQRWYLIRGSIAVILGTIATIVPAVVFDIAHQWLNLNGFLQLTGNKDHFSVYQIPLRVIDNLRIIVETTGKVFFFDTKIPLIMITGIVLYLGFLTIFVQRKKELEQFTVISVGWIFLIGAAFALYRLNKPEYYFFVALPAILSVAAVVIDQVIRNDKVLKIAIGLWFAYAAWMLSLSFRSMNLEIGNQIQFRDDVQRLVEAGKVRDIVYDMTALDAVGPQYLLKPFSSMFQPEGQLLHIMYPVSQDTLSTKTFSNAAIWLDPRVDGTKNYFNQPEFIIETPKEVELLQDYYSTEADQFSKVYRLYVSGVPKAALKSIVKKPENSRVFEELLREVNQSPSLYTSWHLLPDGQIIFDKNPQLLFAIHFPEGISPEERLKILQYIVLH